ncbi:MAG: hypothetical protein DRJ61_07370 [Acidobacteria bacterium]|nr:MAG: hypothetical protein DRJ61_07370 [Acidobacteriota bacterium]
MKHKRMMLVLVALVAVTVGCERLKALQNSNMRIAGEWQKIEMSFPGDKVYDFSDRIITLDGIEEGTYRFESNSMLEVVLNGRESVYEVEFVGSSKMIWYRKTAKGRDRVYEWVKAK